MRRLLIAVSVSSMLALAGCSSGGTVVLSSPLPASPPAGSSPSDQPSAAGGAVDCGGLTKDDAAKFLVYTQVLAQVRDQTSAKAIRDKQFTDYTPAAFAAILAKLQGLAGHPAAGFGDPKDSLDFYSKANDIMTQIAATTGDVPQSLVDQYKALVPDVSTAISRQLPINAALGEYCKNLA